MIDYQPPTDAIKPVYQDADILVVNKPAGLLSVPGRIYKDCLVSRLQADFPTVLCVHRLDMETSGLMVLALHKPAQAYLNKQFEQRRVVKHYRARVLGHPEHESGEISAPLMGDWPNRPKQKVDFDAGKASMTHWQVHEREPFTTLLDLKPITGRSHQLRVHLWHMGLPIVADSLYQADNVGANELATVDKLMHDKERHLLHLHSTFLQFKHPVSEEWMGFNSDVPF